MRKSPCPTASMLAEFDSGTLDETSSDDIAQHLDQCAECREAIENVSSNAADPLVNSLRGGLEKISPLLKPDDPRGVEQASQEVSLSNSERESAIPPNQVRDYEILEVLGKGGMGTVYRARHRHLGRIVALKFILRPSEEMIVSRFLREMKVIGVLSHPNILTAIDAGIDNGRPFLVTEYIDGLDAGRISRHHGPLSIQDACEIGRQTAIGLEYLHRQQMVHRDIKPSNLMVSRKGEVRILDFGLAKHHRPAESDDDELSQTGQTLGTIDYMPPEQAEGVQPIDSRADLYSLGASLFKLLTGVSPLDIGKKSGPMKKLAALSQNRLRDLSELRPDLPESLVKLIQRLLSYDVEQREVDHGLIIAELQSHSKGSHLDRLIEDRQSPRKADTHQMSTETTCLDGVPITEMGSVLTRRENQPQRRGGTVIGAIWVGLLLTAIVVGGPRLGALLFHGSVKNRTTDPSQAMATDAARGVANTPLKPNLGGTTDHVAEPDRTAAEWVLSIGGWVNVTPATAPDWAAEHHWVKSIDNLPRRPFRITRLLFHELAEPIYDDDLRNLRGLAELSHLEFRHPNIAIDGSGLRHMTGSPIVQLALTASAVPLSPEGGAAILMFENLEHLRLDAMQGIKREFLASLSSLKDLRRLNLFSCNIPATELPPVAELRALTLLTLSGNDVSGELLQALSRLPKLKHLNIDYSEVTNADVLAMEGIEQLRFFSMTETSVTIPTLLQLSNRFPLCEVEGGSWLNARAYRNGALIKLNRIPTTPDRAVAEFVLRINGAVDIRFGESTVTVLPGEALPEGVWTLVGVDLSGLAKIRDLQHVFHAKEIESLNLAGTSIGIDSAMFLDDLTSLKRIILPNRHADQWAERLKERRSIRELSFAHSQLTDAGLSYLAEMTWLESLDVSHTTVSPHVIDRLAKFTKLKRLSLNGIALQDAQLDSLSNLKSLEELRITEAQLTDDVVEPLLKMSQLRRLAVIRGNSLTSKAINRLRSGLLSCEIK